MVTDQPLKRRRPQQRHVAREQEDVPVVPASAGFGLQQRMTRAELRLLQSRTEDPAVASAARTRIGLVADDDHD